MPTLFQKTSFNFSCLSVSSFCRIILRLIKQIMHVMAATISMSMKSIEECCPGLKQLLEEKDLSVLAQDRHNVRTAIDQRGEQTITKQKPPVALKPLLETWKWCLNRTEQANNSKALNDMCGIATDAGLYKPLRSSSQVLQTNELVNRIVKVLNEDYINPFGLYIDNDSLFNVGSGVPLPYAIVNDILSIKTVGI